MRQKIKHQDFYSLCVSDKQKYLNFPPTYKSSDEYQGLLAITSLLNENIFLNAYLQGIFPWHKEQQQNKNYYLWFSPSPRLVFLCDSWKAPRNIKRIINHRPHWEITINQYFEPVLKHCINTRKTWICEEIQQVYLSLHRKNKALSFEVHENNRLIGGLISINLHPILFGETMFSLVNGASKVAFNALMKYAIKNQYQLIDGQIESSHLQLLGGTTIERKEFEKYLKLIKL